VHVLTGNFDAEAVAAALRGAFATTALPPPPAVPPAVPRAATARRGAVVPGARQPAVVIAFGLQGNEDPHLLALMASWFGVGPDSWLGRELRRAGRRDVMVHAAAPWPAAAATGLFAIEVLDAAGGAPGLADQVLALCGREVPKQPQTAELRGRHGLLLAAFERDTRRGVDHAARVAVELLRHPSPELPLTPPEQAAFAELPERLQQILDTPPIVVEWRSR
jgi:hypothetical protein